MHLSSDSKLFQALGPATAKDRWPSPVATRGNLKCPKSKTEFEVLGQWLQGGVREC